MDEADEIAPRVAVLHWRQQTLPVETPHLAQNRLQPDAVFICRPQFHLGLGDRGGDLAQERAQARLEGGLRHGIGLDITGARLEKACAKLP